jgi:hypothetical protein
MAEPTRGSPEIVPPSPAPRPSWKMTGVGLVIAMLIGAAIGAYYGDKFRTRPVVPDPAELLKQLSLWIIAFAILGVIQGFRQGSNWQYAVGSALQVTLFGSGVVELLPAAVAWSIRGWGEGQNPVAVGAIVGLCLIGTLGAICLAIERWINQPRQP